jgi:cyanophycinase-like exopeptidase
MTRASASSPTPSSISTSANAHLLIGIGIDENTAIVWSRDGVVTVEGAGEVTIVDPDHRLDAQSRSYRLQVLKQGAKFVAD